MIEAVPLTPEHLARFVPEEPLAGEIPAEQFGQAAAFLCDGEVLAIAGAWDKDGAVEVGLALAVGARRYPVAMHRLARQFLEGLHLMGYSRIRAETDSPRSAAWLRRLGFDPVNGAFECRLH